MKNVTKVISRSLLTLAVAGLGLAVTPSAAHAAFLDFTVDEGVVPGTPADTFIVDKINGAYAERIALNPITGRFDASLFVNFTQYLADEGVTPVSSNLDVPGGDADEYGLYAVVTASGTFSGNGSLLNPFIFEPDTANAAVYVDVDLNTTKTLPATAGNPIIRGNTGDDELVMTATQIDEAKSSGLLRTGLGGNFQLVFINPTIEAFGLLYWPDLARFGLQAINNGDFDDSTIGSDGILTGDVSLTFVPEPATLSLLGMGLFGAGVAARRRFRKA